MHPAVLHLRAPLTDLHALTSARMHQNRMPDFQKTPGGIDLRMVTPVELLIDPERTKDMTADEQRDMIQQLYNEQVSLLRNRNKPFTCLSLHVCDNGCRKMAIIQQKTTAARSKLNYWWSGYEKAGLIAMLNDWHV